MARTAHCFRFGNFSPERLVCSRFSIRDLAETLAPKRSTRPSDLGIAPDSGNRSGAKPQSVVQPPFRRRGIKLGYAIFEAQAPAPSKFIAIGQIGQFILAGNR